MNRSASRNGMLGRGMKTFFPKREIFHWQIGYVRKVRALIHL
jgi:hypothetical protein